jgi:hypothetical protein
LGVVGKFLGVVFPNPILYLWKTGGFVSGELGCIQPSSTYLHPHPILEYKSKLATYATLDSYFMIFINWYTLKLANYAGIENLTKNMR